jgi:hypothetical protein
MIENQWWFLKSDFFMKKSPRNIFVVWKFALPLHSQSGTNATVVVPVKQDDP